MNRQSFGWVVCTSLLLGVMSGCGGGGSSSGSATSDPAPTVYYTVGGTVSGYGGSGLVLQNNSGDDLAIAIDGSFIFAESIADGSAYQVTVKTQPGLPDGYCNVINGSGNLAGGAVSDVSVLCISGLYNVVDTGQDRCYDSYTGAEVTCASDGYDADYNGNQPSYTVSDDGEVVHDNITGLVWTQSADLTGNGVIDVDDKLTLTEAENYCSALETQGLNWRLPNIKELYSLIDFRGGDSSAYSGSDISLLTPFIDDSVFGVGFGDTDAGERVIDGQAASSTIYISPQGTLNGAGTMFGVNFIDGRIKGYPYDFPAENPKTFYVYCVSGNSDYGVNSFSNNEDGTVSDRASGLMWQQGDYPSSDFENALSYCEDLSLASYTNWRLPNVKELQGIVDYDRAPDYSSSAAINTKFSATSFTNEEGVTDWGYYWASTTHAKYEGPGDNATYVAFGRALGYYDEGSGMAVIDVHGAGAQRSNSKQNVAITADGSADLGYGTFYYNGPQGDILRHNNYVRCVRDVE